jgi:hypothetical protein
MKWQSSLIYVFFTCLVLVTGCQKQDTASQNAEKPILKEKVSTDSKTDNIDPKTGNLIAFWLQYPEHLAYPEKEKPILVTEPYAVLMVWLGNEKRFFIYDNTKKETFKTNDFDTFLKQLNTIPKGTAIQKFDTCTATRTYDMPRADANRLEKVMTGNTLTWADTSGFLICYCESTGFRYP